jgi:hypothetical protein
MIVLHASHEQILRLQITMDDTFGVRGGEARGDLLRVFKRSAHRYRAGLQLRAQFLAFQ